MSLTTFDSESSFQIRLTQSCLSIQVAMDGRWAYKIGKLYQLIGGGPITPQFRGFMFRIRRKTKGFSIDNTKAL